MLVECFCVLALTIDRRVYCVVCMLSAYLFWHFYFLFLYIFCSHSNTLFIWKWFGSCFGRLFFRFVSYSICTHACDCKCIFVFFWIIYEQKWMKMSIVSRSRKMFRSKFLLNGKNVRFFLFHSLKLKNTFFLQYFVYVSPHSSFRRKSECVEWKYVRV